MLLEKKLDDLILRSGDDDPDAVAPDANIMTIVPVTVLQSFDNACPLPTFVTAITRVTRNVTCDKIFVTQLTWREASDTES